MNIAIIGAGISGLLSALELVERGCTVTIFDQQRTGSAASWAGGGILSPMYPWRYPNEVNALARYGKQSYQKWNEKLKPMTGIDFEIHETGMLIFDEDDFEIGLDYACLHQDPMQQAEYLQSEQIEQINPHISARFAHGIYFSQLANIRNPRLLQSLTAYLQQHPNVIIHEHCPVTDLNTQQQRLVSIRTADGQQHFADQYVLATGAWSAKWSKHLEIEIPVQPVQGQMLLFKTPQNWLPTMCMNKVMYLIPRQDGHVVCGSSMRQCGFDTQTTDATLQHIQESCFDMVPELANFPIVKSWAGLRPSSPEGIPYIGQMPNFDNLWANFGHFRNGLCMGPASAQLLAELMTGETPSFNADHYSPSRLFQDALLSVE
ncbi:glycine oxidase ThiO [Acinetobacter sp. YH12040]|uniref:glycine oxidase ThiO n=1 Tax=Acinetobacter sp. YH12040 TaxID=2601048 RepID=UPI0015D31501|nr:glycine oxidase ThiO [Acinetobacter sp. YH12040]